MEGGLQVHIQRLVHKLFDEPICASGSLCQPLCQCPGCFFKLYQGNTSVDQSNTLGFWTTDFIGQHRHLYSSTQPNEPWQRVPAAAIRNQANACEGFEQASIVSSNAHITSKGDVQGGTSCYTLNCSDDWFGHVTDGEDQAVILRQVFDHFEWLASVMSGTELREVLTSPKCSSSACEHDAADRIIMSNRFDCFGKLL